MNATKIRIHFNHRLMWRNTDFNLTTNWLYFSQKTGFAISCKLSPIWIKYQNLFSWKNKKKYFNISPAEIFAQSVKRQTDIQNLHGLHLSYVAFCLFCYLTTQRRLRLACVHTHTAWSCSNLHIFSYFTQCMLVVTRGNDTTETKNPDFYFCFGSFKHENH